MENSNNGQLYQNLDLRKCLSIFMHWLWLIILVTLLAGLGSYLFSKSMRPFYRSSSTLLVNEAPATKSTDYTSVLMSKQLTSTYAEMMTKDSVLNQVIDEVRLKNTVEDLKEWITVEAINDTQLIQITVETSSPKYSAIIANTIVSVFAEQIQEIQIQRFAQSKTALEAQLAQTNEQISEYSAQIKTAKGEEKTTLESQLAQAQSTYSNLLLTYEQIRLSETQSVSSVVQVETAVPDDTPVRPKVLVNTVLAALLGFFLSACVVFTREALDDTIKTPNDIIHRFKIPVLGVINKYPANGGLPISFTQPRSPTAEAYRALRTNVSYTSVDKPLKTILVTSSEPGEGKSTTICNLAVVMAQNGNQVILMDSDMRHPRIHTYFGLSNHIGMSLLFAHPEVLKGIRQSTKVDGLSIITTGPLPPNPAELMGSKKMQSILQDMDQIADVILIDTPPVLAVTDAAALAPSIDGVILVALPGKTRFNALKQTLDQLNQVNANVLGVVLNNVVTRGKSYGYQYQEYRNYTAYKTYYGEKNNGEKGTKHNG